MFQNFTFFAILSLLSVVAGYKMKTCYAAERNKGPILEVLAPRVALLGSNERQIKVLEIASGTGEHAAFFASNIRNLLYQPSEPDLNMHESIIAWKDEAQLSEQNSLIRAPISIDLLQEEDKLLNDLPEEFSNRNVQVMICINMIHISPFSCTASLFKVANKCLSEDGFLMTYGPYRVDGHMVESNVAFDESLKARNPQWGVRDIEAVEAVANAEGFYVKSIVNMPANNLCVFFARKI